MSSYFSWERFHNNTPIILSCLNVTLQLVVISLIFITIFAIILAVLRMKRIPVIHQIIGVYISYMRGTPLITQLFVVKFGLPMLLNNLFGINIYRWDNIIFAEIAIIMNEAAFLGETFRGALASVPALQIEAAYSIGMTKTQTFFRVTLPQFIRIILPTYGTTIVAIFMGTSVVFMLGVLDIMGRAKIIASSTSHGLEAYLIVAIIYIVASLVVRVIFHGLENKMNYGRG